MKRHAIYFALALAGAAFTLQAAPLPAMPDPSLPVSHFITQVNADKSLARHDQGSGRSLDMEKRADEAQSL